MRSTRNDRGFKDTIDCYRTINGEKYISWAIYPAEERRAAYKQAGAKTRQIKETLYVRDTDIAIVASVDAE